MACRIKLGSLEFLALQDEWNQKLADDGFDDIERPPPCRSSGDPRRHAAYHRHYIRSDNPGHGHPVPLDDLLAAEDADAPPLLARDSVTPLWEGPFDLHAAALARFSFKSSIDREIVRRLVAGQSHREIAARLRVGHDRIARVVRDIRKWARD